MIFNMENKDLEIWKEIQKGELSEDYKERFKAEYRALVIRLKKLEVMIYKYNHDMLNFKPSCPLHVLVQQLDHMENYAKTLRERAVIEQIELW